MARYRNTQEYFQGLREACDDAALLCRTVARCSSTQECFQELREACGDAALPYSTVARWIKAFREGSDAVQNNLRTG